MRRTLVAVSLAAAVASGAVVLGSGSARAVVAAPGLGDVAHAVSPVETAGCFRWGWHGFGWYPWCGPRPLWWRHHWGWHRPWGWHRGWARGW